MTTENRIIIEGALTSLLTTGDVGALAALLRDDFVHHRPDRTSTRTEWLAAVRTALGPLAEMRVEIVRMLAAGDHVVMYSRRHVPGGPEIVVVDIWRLADGLIAEAWEIIEPTAQARDNLRWWDPVARAAR